MNRTSRPVAELELFAVRHEPTLSVPPSPFRVPAALWIGLKVCHFSSRNDHLRVRPEAALCVDSCWGPLDSSTLAPKADPQDGKGWWKRLAVFEHQPTFAANERGTHLAGQELHPVKDSFLFASLGELYSRVGERNRGKLQAPKFAPF